MKLALPLPNGWEIDGVALGHGWVEELDGDEAGHRERILGLALPDGATAAVTSVRATETVSGWPLTFVEVEVVGADGALVEVRLGAFYTFIDHTAAALVRARSRDRLEAASAELTAALRQGELVLDGEVAGIAELLGWSAAG
jgi:hypothetical protein